MHHVGFREIHGDVAVGVSGLVVVERDGLTVQVKIQVLLEKN